MLFGTGILFRISYFFTAFAPALLIISFQYAAIELENKKMMSVQEMPMSASWIQAIITNVTQTQYFWSYIVIVCAIIAVCYINIYLKKRQLSQEYLISNLALNFNRKKKELSNENGYMIQVQEGIKINSGFVKFATSVLVPSILVTLLKENQIMLPLIITFVFFLLLMSSNDTFPNIVLPMCGIQVMTTKEGYNIFYFSKNKDSLSGVKKVHSLGNGGSLARTYVIIDEDVIDEKVKDINDV